MTDTPMKRAAWTARNIIVEDSCGAYFPSLANCEQMVRDVLAALAEPSEAMIEAACGALKAHIAALPPYIRAKCKEPGGFVLVDPREKHAIRWRAMLAEAMKPESGETI